MMQPTRQEEPLSPGRGLRDALTLFSFFWATATLFHIASYDLWRGTRVEIAAAMWVLLRPGSTIALLALAAVQIYETFPLTLDTSNHSLLAAFVNAGLFMTAGALMLKERRFVIERGDLFKAFAPAARLALLAFYFFAVFHKLNTDWFDPQESCATVFYAAQRSRFPFLPSAAGFNTGAIYLSLGSEAAIPLLLAFRRTRHAGILVGAVFHWLVGLNPISGFYNFSAMLLALYVPFADLELMATARDRLERGRLLVLSSTLACVFAACAFIGQRPFNWRIELSDFFLWFWAAYGAILIAGFAVLIYWRRTAQRHGVPLFRLPQPVLAILPIVVCLNGLMPYLGLKTTATWAMYSNLRTEGGASNHWFVPAELQMFDYQRDLVKVTSSSDRYLRTLVNRPRQIPYFEIRRKPNAAISYVRGGTKHRFERVSDDPSFSGPIPFLVAQFMAFRPVNQDVKQDCEH